MTFILSAPAAAPALLASPDNRAPARSGEQDSSQPGSFGEALARSREAGQQKAAEPIAKPAASKAVRRPADEEKASAQDSANPLAGMLAVPLESRLAATASAAGPGGAAAATAAVPAGKPGIPADAGLGGLLTAAPAAPGGPADAPGLALDPGAQAALAPGLATSLAKGADLSPAQAPATTASSVLDMSAQAALAPGLATNLAKGADLSPAQARSTAASIGMPLAADPRAVTARDDAAGAGLPDPSSEHGSEGLDNPASSGPTEPAREPADTTAFSGTGPLTPPAGAALQQPGGPAAQNAPAPVVSALLAPDVGSSEWGKALGQQVIHLSAADRQVAELQLNPPGLGPLKITLSMNDQQMQVAFVSAHSSVRVAVEAALPQLRTLLAESGISLGQTSVGAESQPQTEFSNNQGDSGGSSRANYRSLEADKTALLFSAPPAALQTRTGQGLRIDTYA